MTVEEKTIADTTCDLIDKVAATLSEHKPDLDPGTAYRAKTLVRTLCSVPCDVYHHGGDLIMEWTYPDSRGAVLIISPPGDRIYHYELEAEKQEAQG